MLVVRRLCMRRAESVIFLKLTEEQRQAEDEKLTFKESTAMGLVMEE